MALRRAELHMSLRTLASKVKRSPSHISNVENGKQPPSEALLRSILGALDVPRGDHDAWFASAGIVPKMMVDALLAHPEAWLRLRAILDGAAPTTGGTP
jgi:transcriptional regulator with XRE-family HTH domain